MSEKIKGENIADGFLVFSQVAFFTAILINYLTNAQFSEKVFIGVAGFLLGISIIAMIIKFMLNYR